VIGAELRVSQSIRECPTFCPASACANDRERPDLLIALQPPSLCANARFRETVQRLRTRSEGPLSAYSVEKLYKQQFSSIFATRCWKLGAGKTTYGMGISAIRSFSTEYALQVEMCLVQHWSLRTQSGLPLRTARMAE
jgi:hypothetical protein